MRYVPETLGQVSDQLAAMATNAPRYEWIYNPDGDPIGEFDRTRKGLTNIRSKLGERAYEYLLARVEENWIRLQSGDSEDLRQLKLSFGEMSHFLSVKQYKAEDITSNLVAHTDVR